MNSERWRHNIWRILATIEMNSQPKRFGITRTCNFSLQAISLGIRPICTSAGNAETNTCITARWRDTWRRNAENRRNINAYIVQRGRNYVATYWSTCERSTALSSWEHRKWTVVVTESENDTARTRLKFNSIQIYEIVYNFSIYLILIKRNTTYADKTVYEAFQALFVHFVSTLLVAVWSS